MSTATSRDFRLLWGASTISNLGDGIRNTAIPLLTVAITTDPLAVGAVTAAMYMPWMLFALVGGAAVDRVDRRALILVGQLVRGSAVAGFGVLVFADRAVLALVYVVAFVIGAGEVVVDSAMQAAVPRVAGDDLDVANSRIASAQFVAGEAIGGPIGGVLFAISAGVPFAVDAITFGLGALLISLISTPLQEPATPDRARSSVVADIAEGITFLRDQPVLRGVAIAVTLSNFADAAATALLVLLVTDILDGSEWAFGLVISVGALGGLAGSLVSARVVAIFGRRRALVAAFIIMALGQLGIALAPSVVAVAAGSFVVLFAVALFNVSGQSIRQRLTPDRLLGRVIASMRFFGMGAVPLGGIGGGLLARAVGVRETIVVSAAIGVAATIAIVRATAGQDLEGSVNPA